MMIGNDDTSERLSLDVLAVSVTLGNHQLQMMLVLMLEIDDFS